MGDVENNDVLDRVLQRSSLFEFLSYVQVDPFEAPYIDASPNTPCELSTTIVQGYRGLVSNPSQYL